jgi:hypothetical protein
MTDTELLTTDQLRKRLEKVWLKHIKLCQDNFLYFVKNLWPDFICRTERDPDKWDTTNILHTSSQRYQKIKKEGSS